MPEGTFFNGWSPVLRTLVLGIIAYVGLVIAVRFAGKRTLAQLDEFDLVVLVAVGNILSSLMVMNEVSLVQGAAGLLVLLMLQVAVTLVVTRAPRLESVLKTQPSLLVLRGRLLTDALRESRVTENEVRQAIRNAGIADMEDAQAVVLETNGSFSVLGTHGKSWSALRDVPGYRTSSTRPENGPVRDR